VNRAPPNTKMLYLLRHAKSSWKDETLADRERPLAGRGRKAAERMAELMRAEAIAPALVLCSPALRTRETLERVMPGLGDEAEVEVEEALYGAGAEDLLARLHRVPPDVPSVMLVGHNPGLEQLALSLARSGERLDDLREKYPTGALATLAFQGSWEDLRPDAAELAALVKPRELES
jgi:phosphohistidine phosphatase